MSRYAVLPTQFADIAHGTPAVIAGWGYNETNGVIQEHLQEADLIIFSDEECRNRHEEIIHPSHICAGLTDGGRGGCSVRSVSQSFCLVLFSHNFCVG